ncbi:hypothetical protein RhiJN_26193 [Ceratobasidium sp. AG-Ba]|nr:hypothetical protein RhiJN_26193 [Ceratobasidium sp. AG-Ba]
MQSCVYPPHSLTNSDFTGAHGQYSHSLDPNFATTVYNNFACVNPPSAPIPAPEVPTQLSPEELNSIGDLDFETKQSLNDWMSSFQFSSDFSQFQDLVTQEFLPLTPSSSVAPSSVVTPSPTSAIAQPAFIASGKLSDSNPASNQPQSSISAIYVFEANVHLNENHASDMMPWDNMAKKANLQGVGSTKQAIDWNDAACSLGRSDFRAFYYRQREHARAQNTPIPILPVWIVQAFFNGRSPEGNRQERLPRPATNSGHVVVERAPNRTASTYLDQMKGKYRAAPYSRPHASTSRVH